MAEWSVTVFGGAIQFISDDAIAIHTGYLFGNTTAIRTTEGFVLVELLVWLVAPKTWLLVQRRLQKPGGPGLRHI